MRRMHILQELTGHTSNLLEHYWGWAVHQQSCRGECFRSFALLGAFSPTGRGVGDVLEAHTDSEEMRRVEPLKESASIR